MYASVGMKLWLFGFNNEISLLQASRQPGKYKEESESSDSDEWDDEEDPDNMNVPGMYGAPILLRRENI